MAPDSKPRLTVEIRKDQALRLQTILPHGMRVLLISALLDGVLALYDKEGFEAITNIIGGHVSTVQLAEAGKPYTHQALTGDG